MNPENAIEVHHVSKSFKIYEDRGNMLRQRIVNHRRGKYTRREVLHDISFDIRKGETVGLIGANGCGKSTTLKMLTKILRPNEGTIETTGKVYSMIELGAGFHPDMTGRENIYINASIFGIRRKEVDRRIDDIIRFSELEKFIDNPVRTYSSGMYLRLAFSVAINVDADILLVDEILAVGDQNFQAKCLRRLRELQQEGITIVLVSHSMDQVESFCDRAIWIKNGSIEEDGPSRMVCGDYKESQVVKSKKRQEDEIAEQEHRKKLLEFARKVIPQCDPSVSQGGKRELVFTRIELLDAQGQPCTAFRQGEGMRVRIAFHKNPDSANPVDPDEEKQQEATGSLTLSVSNITVEMIRWDWLLSYGNSTRAYFQSAMHLDADGKGEVEDVFEDLTLMPGTYHLNICMYDQNDEVQDFYNYCIEFTIAGTQISRDETGVFSLRHHWNEIGYPDPE